MVYKLFNAFVGRVSGVWCRRCGESITPRDSFGVSEGVCAACREL